MNNANKADKDKTRTDEKRKPLDMGTTKPWASPGADPTNPYNRGPAGSWSANERAAERRNNEPGLTDRDRTQRKW